MVCARYLVAIFAAFLLEGAVASRLAVGGAHPDLGLALVVYAGLFHGRPLGVGVGFLVGLLRGCLEPEWFGLEALLLPWVGFAAGSTSNVLNRSHPILQGILIAALLLLHDLARAGVLAGASPAGALALWVSEAPGTALYTALVVPPAVLWLPRLLAGRGGRALR
ncbi:MAG: rod shape-determining protein MreD [Candidatus Eisenbacteria bacterium]|uniref:Rod shape-determining protein MreD n=1 Tax=Eiseniibacteriota bacterium TaxID=2212470 RepID=A0A938BMD0_UNCEI|nr:rod shape-determining protein MreD [Candidatus Eisenbacteria bacterium]